MTARNFTDEELTSVLDGEADGTLTLAVEEAMKVCPTLTARLERLSVLTDGLPVAMGHLLSVAPAMPVLPAAVQASARFGWVQSAAVAAALVLGIGIGGYIAVPTAGPAVAQGWMGYVAAYQALYVPQTVAIDAPSAAEAGAQVAGLSAVLGRDLSGALAEVGLEYRRGQVLGFEGRPLVQLAYAGPDGAPFALCIIALPGGEDVATTTATFEGLAAAHWTEGGYGFLLIGGEDAGLIERAAGGFRAAI